MATHVFAASILYFASWQRLCHSIFLPMPFLHLNAIVKFPIYKIFHASRAREQETPRSNTGIALLFAVFNWQRSRKNSRTFKYSQYCMRIMCIWMYVPTHEHRAHASRFIFAWSTCQLASINEGCEEMALKRNNNRSTWNAHAILHAFSRNDLIAHSI